jgi:hypothetical protein
MRGRGSLWKTSIKTEEQLLFKREFSRLLSDYRRCLDPMVKEIIGEEIMLLKSVLGKEKNDPIG